MKKGRQRTLIAIILIMAIITMTGCLEDSTAIIQQADAKKAELAAQIEKADVETAEITALLEKADAKIAELEAAVSKTGYVVDEISDKIVISAHVKDEFSRENKKSFTDIPYYKTLEEALEKPYKMKMKEYGQTFDVGFYVDRLGEEKKPEVTIYDAKTGKKESLEKNQEKENLVFAAEMIWHDSIYVVGIEFESEDKPIYFTFTIKD